MLGEFSAIFVGMRPTDVRRALKLGPDVEVLLYPQYGGLLSSCQGLLSSGEVLITFLVVMSGPPCVVLARFLDIASDEGALWGHCPDSRGVTIPYTSVSSPKKGRGRCRGLRTEGCLLAAVQDLELEWRANCCPWVEVSSSVCVGASVFWRMSEYGAVVATH